MGHSVGYGYVMTSVLTDDGDVWAWCKSAPGLDSQEHKLTARVGEVLGVVIRSHGIWCTRGKLVTISKRRHDIYSTQQSMTGAIDQEDSEQESVECDEGKTLIEEQLAINQKGESAEQKKMLATAEEKMSLAEQRISCSNPAIESHQQQKTCPQDETKFTVLREQVL